MNRIQIEIDEKTLRRLVVRYLSEQIGTELSDKDVLVETKSTQNYRAEWESALFRARIQKDWL